MAEGRRPQVSSIPPHRAFSDALATGLLAQFGDDRLNFARGLILVPNNRAAQAVTAAFVRQAESGLLLPRLVAIGDPELGERTGAMLDPADAPAIPPAIDPLRRRFVLARLIQRQRSGLNAAEAMRLADDLGRVLDQLHIERIAPKALRKVDTGALSHHWQISLDQLSAILDDWPSELERLGAIDLSDRRNRLLDAVAGRWRDAPPTGFVVAAGISTTAPAIAALLAVIARLPKGQIVLAGLDRAIDDEEWDAIGDGEETHPQHHLHRLLERMSVARGEVREWRWGSDHDARAARGKALSEAMAPAAFTPRWADAPRPGRAFEGVHAIELSTPAEEAQAIAIALREALETEGRTAALVTPDRDLAARVSALLKRWAIEADDSAGWPLSASLPGALLLALAEAVAADFAPAPLLALLKHPLVTGGLERTAWLAHVRVLDLALRGPRPAPGLEGVSAALREGDARTQRIRDTAQPGWETIRAVLDPVATAYAAAEDLPAHLAALRDALTALAGDAVWARQEGRTLADLFADAEALAVDGPALSDRQSLPLLLRHLLDGVSLRPAQGGHPRISIYGLIEARLQTADLMILGGLNEGVWPGLPKPDPWLAPAIRRALHLPTLEDRIGREAHDLAGAMGAPQVLLTRARRDARSPVNASRFWLRIATLSGGLAPPSARPDRLARALDSHRGAPLRSTQPAPAPPLAARPKKISVTQVDQLNADPFAWYAQTILNLSALDRVDAEPGAAWRGSLIHAALETWAKVDAYAPDALPRRISEALATPGIHPLTRALWEPRLCEAAEWIAAQVTKDRESGRVPVLAEERGEIDYAGVRLSGVADRIDKTETGTLAIVDYKTGAAPSMLQVHLGLAWQLALLGLIAERDGFKGVSGRSERFEYWSLARQSGKSGFGKRSSPTEGKSEHTRDKDHFVAEAAAAFTRTVERWLTGAEPFKAKLHPEYAYGDYDHLMRLEEWQGRND